MLVPVYGIIGLAIFADDPGPIFFLQKRVGKDNHYFELHKFRSMKISAPPHGPLTHWLRDPEQYKSRKDLAEDTAEAVVNHDASICKCSQIDCNAVVAAGAIVSEKTKIQSCTVWNTI
jgi:lipopolysaccharide/colanic/teichoic acid biosynthesis glycosyltransferase